MPVLEGHQDHAVIDPDGRAVHKCVVIGPRWQADIVDDEAALALRDDFANLVLDRLENPLGRFDSGSGGRANVQLDLPAVDDGEEVATYK